MGKMISRTDPVIHLVDGGYISISGTTPTYHYYLKDHLGNNRVVVDASGTVKQVTHYYPFGGFFGESIGSSYQAYKYNGKEFERLISEDWYDYGARHMDGMRFTTIDPLAEKYYNISPYAYCANNPVHYVDHDGRDPGDFFKSLDLAAQDFGNYTNPLSIKNNREYATSFYMIKNKEGEVGYSYTQPRMGGSSGVSSYKYISRKNGKVVESKNSTKEKAVATGHTHGAYDEKTGLGNDVFSGLLELRGKDDTEARKNINDKSKDIGSSNDASIQDYLVTPSGTLQHYDPFTGKIRIVNTEMPKDPNDINKLENIKNYYGQK